MDSIVEKELKQEIDSAEVVSFDVFDTLLLRKVSHPEDVFDIVSNRVNEPDFKKQRREAQKHASEDLFREKQYPHANLDEIYQELSKVYGGKKSEEIKSAELAVEREVLYCNPEIRKIFYYAREQHKRIIAVTDMYISAQQIEGILKNCGIDADRVYCSADLRKAKFNEQIFQEVLLRENTAPQKMLHIGDNRLHDFELPRKLGIRTFWYTPAIVSDDCDLSFGSDDLIFGAVYRSLYKKERGFWYNLGLKAGGPIYLGLYFWLQSLGILQSKKLYLLSRDGYCLHKLLSKLGYKNAEYLETSRRALLLAGMTSVTKENLQQLPPFTLNQTLNDILKFINFPIDKLKGLSECGFSGLDDRIKDSSDKLNFQKLYRLNSEAFLSVCSRERKNAVSYLKSIGVGESDDAVFFDCGWSGSSQYLLEKLLDAAGKKYSTDFYYFGIKKSQKSSAQLSGKSFKTFAFGPDQQAEELEMIVNESTVVSELFFSAPHASVKCYSDDGKPVFDDDSFNRDISDLFDGIADFVIAAIPLVEQLQIKITPEKSLRALRHLIESPTERESIEIGNIKDFDSWTIEDNNTKYVGYITEHQFNENLVEIYWPQGLFRRPDIAESLKKKVAERLGLKYSRHAPKYNLEDFQSIANYHKYLAKRKHKKAEQYSGKAAVRFSVVMPVYNTAEEQLSAAVGSVLSQTYPDFELILVDDCSSWKNVRPFLNEVSHNEHVKVFFREKNGGISEATNTGLKQASGDFIVFMDCDDTLESNALLEFSKTISRYPDTDLIYSDEDKITEDGKVRHLPFFKPDWSPDLFLSMMYTNHLSAFRASLVSKTGGLRSEYNGAQDYDFLLRFYELTDPKKIRHIPEVLYHWRERAQSISQSMSAKSNVPLITKFLKEDYLRRNGIPGYAEEIPFIGQYRVVYSVSGNPKVSIVIPSKDNPDQLRKCVDSITGKTAYKNYEIIVVDNGSDDADREAIASYLRAKKCRYIYEKSDFNFSKICNRGASEAKGDFLLFLNDGISIIQDSWLSRMLGACQQKHIGAVGAKIYYSDSRLIWHSGISNTSEGPSYNFSRWDDSKPSYFAFNWVDYDCAAVSGACLMVSAADFRAAGGFNESLPHKFSDADLCYRLIELGKYNTVRNDVCCSINAADGSDGDLNSLRLRKNRSALKKLYRLHPDFLNSDPFLNPNIHRYAVPLSCSYVNPASAREVEKLKGRFNADLTDFSDSYNRKLKPVDKAILKLLDSVDPEGPAYNYLINNFFIRKRLNKIEHRTGSRLWEKRRFDRFCCPSDISRTADAHDITKPEGFCCYIDILSFNISDDSLSMSGWYVFRGVSSDDGKMEFVIRTGRNRFIKLPFETILRKDVTNFYHDGTNYDKAGFFIRQNFSRSILERKFSAENAFFYYENKQVRLLIPITLCAHDAGVVFTQKAK